MFVSHEVTVDAAFEVTSARLMELINRDALHDVSEAAYVDGLQMLVRVGPLGSTPGLSRLVRVHARVAVRNEVTMTVALRWEATGPVGDLFPVLDADLVLAAQGDERSRLGLVGSYRPPLGQVGVALDRVIMSRLAAATIRSLVDAMAAAVTAPEPVARPDVRPRLRPPPNPVSTDRWAVHLDRPR